jgi:hypothetical protein
MQAIAPLFLSLAVLSITAPAVARPDEEIGLPDPNTPSTIVDKDKR